VVAHRLNLWHVDPAVVGGSSYEVIDIRMTIEDYLFPRNFGVDSDKTLFAEKVANVIVGADALRAHDEIDGRSAARPPEFSSSI